MSISRETDSGHTTLNRRAPHDFRVRLTLLLMAVVFTVTILALVITQHSAQVADRRALQDEFQNRLGYLLGAQETREAEVSQRCRALARSVRIQAALEEHDIDDLYANAAIDLRDILGTEDVPAISAANSVPRATFFRFLTLDGKPLVPTGGEAKAWEAQLSAVAGASASQQIGYMNVENGNGESVLNEVVSTPILGEGGEPIADLVLGFPPVEPVRHTDSNFQTGILVGRKLHLPALAAEDREALGASLGDLLSGAGDSTNLQVQIHGESYLLSYKILNPGSKFPPAYEVCLYSLTASLAQQEELRWRILGSAAAILVFGFGASHFLSTRLAKPVEQLAQVSEQNVERREKAEAARELTEQKYQSIFENAVEGIFLLAPDTRLLSANPAMARIFGFDSPGQFIARMPRLHIAAERAAELLGRVNEDGTVSGFECESARCDGTPIWISVNGRAVRGSKGELLHVEGTLEDITERKRAADALKRLNAELEKALGDLKATQKQVIQQERLRALGQMASGIAHDFNNSLMPVMGFSELLLAQPAILQDHKRAAGYLEMIRTAAKDAASIVARLREFYRSNENSDVFGPVDLAQLLKQVVSLTQPKWKGQARAQGVEIHIEEEIGSVAMISGDESALREVFANLIFNAVDAMPKGGTIAVRARTEGMYVVAEISDTGGGMSEEVRQRCFEPFFTTKGERGTGLGLAMVFGIVQRHEGTVDLQTQAGKGTTFVLSFPARAVSTRLRMHESQPLPAMGSLRILLVDDEPQVREVLTAFLEVDGHETESAENGIVAVNRLRESPFDLVITDRSMPGMSGEQMAQEIKKFLPKMPIILLSGFTHPDENEKLPGISVVISKPVAMPALRKAIRIAMEST